MSDDVKVFGEKCSSVIHEPNCPRPHGFGGGGVEHSDDLVNLYVVKVYVR